MADIKEKQQQEPVALQQSRSRASSNADAAETAKETRIEVPDEKKEPEGAGFGNYTRIWSYAQPLDRVMHTVGFLSAIGSGTAIPLMNLVFGRLVNEFNEFPTDRAPTEEDAAKFRSIVNKSALWFVYLFIGKFVLVYLHTTSFTITATRITTRLRIAYIKSILRQEVAYFDVCTPGTVSSKISTNANLIQSGIAEKVGTAMQGLSMLISAFAVAFSQQWKLTLVTITTLPAVVFMVGMTVMFDQKYETQILATYAKAGSLAEEVLSSVRNVVAFGAHKKLRGQYEACLDVAKTYGVKKGPVLGVQYSAEFSIAYCAYALAFWYGTQLLLKGEVADGGKVVTVLFSCIIATSSLTMIAPSIGEFTKAAAAAKDIFDMIDREPEIDSTGTSGDKPEAPVVGRIELKNISFCYPARPTIKVLDDVSLVLEERKTTALVGASGSGKSTIVALAERWYDPAEGSISLDGHELKDLNLKWLRSQMGLVSQEPVLFNDTVLNNVWYGASEAQKESSTEEQKRALVKEACIEANADSFIEDLPEGYETNVGERAGLISGGQKQRIALARSIISNPAILLLDEATSALDPKSEALVQAALDKVARSRTTILIAHRLSTVKSADKIVVLSKGKIVEQGSHDELLRAEGAYYTLIKAQTLKSSDQADDDIKDQISASVDQTDAGALYKAETQHSTWSNKSEPTPENPDKRISLLRCTYILFAEHSNLWLWYLLGLVCCVIGGAVFPAQAFIFSRAVTVFMYTGAKLKSESNFWALMFFFLAIATFFAYGGIGFVWTRLAFIMTRSYRSEYFAALTRQDIAFYDHPDNSSGALTSRLSSDPQNVHDMIQGNLGLLLIVFVNLTSSLTLALIFGWKLALVAIFGPLPIVFAAGLIRMRLELSALERTSKFFLESARFASEAVGSIRTVSSLTLEDDILTRYTEKLHGPVKDAYKRVLKVMLLFGLSESVDLLGMAFTFWYGGRLLSYGEYTQEQFFFIFTAVVFGGQAAGMLFGFTSNLTKCHVSANHIFHLRAKIAPINGSTGDAIPEPDDDTPHIELRDVRFSYPTRSTIPVLRTTNLSIPRGASIGLVGASGCGKTTIIALLERFYDVISGSILINGAPLTSLDVAAYRSKIALVAQEPVLYQGTIRENILLGLADDLDPAASSLDALVEKAAKDANIHDFIMGLPAGYNTDVGSKGVALSGGQRQRLAIARALVRDPEILLLDEATSALDTESERVVQAAIEKASKGRTVVAVAHRLSTVRGCDKIVVLDGGRVVEEGRHEVLWQRRGVYWAMCQGQSLDRETQ